MSDWQSIATPLIQRWESFRAQSYLCPAGVWTIGWGSTGPDIKQGMRWSLDQADIRFAHDLKKFGDGVSALLKVPVTAGEMAALTSFAYNVGLSALKSSTLLRKLNAGDREGAKTEFGRWVYGTANGKRIKLKGLVARRADEAKVFSQ